MLLSLGSPLALGDVPVRWCHCLQGRQLPSCGYTAVPVTSHLLFTVRSISRALIQEEQPPNEGASVV